MSEETTERVKFSDPETMRALAHPARVAVIEYLSREDEATATECAKVVGLSPSAMSYHLRALAKFGFLEQAPSRGDGRERVWRRKLRNWAIGPEYGAPESDQLAGQAMLDAVMRHQDELMSRWHEQSQDAPREWYEASTNMTSNLWITAAELKDLLEQIQELTRPYTDRREAGEVPEDARAVMVLTRAFPVV